MKGEIEMPKRIELDEKLLEQYFRVENRTMDNIAELMNVNRHTVMRRIKTLGLVRLYEDKDWLQQQLENNTTPKQMCEIAHCSSESIRVNMRKYDLDTPESYRKRKYDYDTTFFKNIDSEEKAYWLGFLLADGGISATKSQWRVRIQLARCDKGHLEKFRLALKTSVPIIDGKTYLKVTDKWYDNSVIKIYSKEIVQDLIELGVLPNKSAKEIVPKFDMKYIKPFIRGLFDGDGCFCHYEWLGKRCINKSTAYQFNIVSSEEVLLFVSKVFKDIFDINVVPKLGDGIYEINIGGNIQVSNIMNWLYNGSNIHLDRKYSKWHEISQ